MVKKTDQINEFKSDDDQSEVPDPAGSGDAHANRSADQDNGEKAIKQFATKAEAMSAAVSAFSGLTKLQISDYLAGLDAGKNKRPLDKNLKIVPAGLAKEDIDEIFDGTELSEEIKEKTTTVFEAAVNVRALQEQARLEEEFEDKLTEAVEEIRTELTEKVDEYLTYVAERWLEENEVALQNQLKVTMAENFLTALKDMLVENSFSLPENVDLVTDLHDKVRELEERLAEEIEAQGDLKEELAGYQLDVAFGEITEGLTVTQAEKLRELSEGIEYDSVEQYATKLQTIKETYFDKKAKPTTSTLNEEYDGSDDEQNKTAIADPVIQGYAKQLSRKNIL